MLTLLAYVWTPVLMTVLALGLGLLLERVTRWRLPSALLAPVGIAAAVPLTMTIYRLHGTGIVAAVAALVLASALASRRFRWTPALVLAGGLAAFCALLFVVALGLPIPIIGPWLRP